MIKTIYELVNLINQDLADNNHMVRLDTGGGDNTRIQFVIGIEDIFIKYTSIGLTDIFYGFLSQKLKFFISGPFDIQYNNTRSCCSLWRDGNTNVFDECGKLNGYDGGV